jgi:hypothetical protein
VHDTTAKKKYKENGYAKSWHTSLMLELSGVRLFARPLGRVVRLPRPRLFPARNVYTVSALAAFGYNKVAQKGARKAE